MKDPKAVLKPIVTLNSIQRKLAWHGDISIMNNLYSVRLPTNLSGNELILKSDAPSWLPSVTSTERNPMKMILLHQELPKTATFCQHFQDLLDSPDESTSRHITAGELDVYLNKDEDEGPRHWKKKRVKLTPVAKRPTTVSKACNFFDPPAPIARNRKVSKRYKVSRDECMCTRSRRFDSELNNPWMLLSKDVIPDVRQNSTEDTDIEDITDLNHSSLKSSFEPIPNTTKQSSAKNMDMRKLKRPIWKLLTRQTDVNETIYDDRAQVYPERLSKIYRALQETLPQRIKGELSVSLALVALLNLCNEHILHLTGQEGNMDVQIEAATSNNVLV